MLTSVFAFVNMPQASSTHLTEVHCMDFNVPRGTQKILTQDGITVISIAPGAKNLHFEQFGFGGPRVLLNHSGGGSTPYLFFFGGLPFTLLRVDVPAFGQPQIFRSSSGAIQGLVLGVNTFGPGFADITSFTWEIGRSGSGGFDNVCILFNPTIDVGIDVKPGSDPNSYPCKDVNKEIPVAVLSTEDFDATTIDADTVRYGVNGNEAAEVHQKKGEAKRHVEDKNKDGLLDMVFHFKLSDTGFSCSDIATGEKSVLLSSTLTGKTTDEVFEGTDSLRLVRN